MKSQTKDDFKLPNDRTHKQKTRLNMKKTMDPWKPLVKLTCNSFWSISMYIFICTYVYRQLYIYICRYIMIYIYTYIYIYDVIQFWKLNISTKATQVWSPGWCHLARFFLRRAARCGSATGSPSSGCMTAPQKNSGKWNIFWSAVIYDWLVVEPYPSEKYESQLGWWNSQLNGKIKSCSKPPTRNPLKNHLKSKSTMIIQVAFQAPFRNSPRERFFTTRPHKPQISAWLLGPWHFCTTRALNRARPWVLWSPSKSYPGHTSFQKVRLDSLGYIYNWYNHQNHIWDIIDIVIRIIVLSSGNPPWW